MQLEIIIRSEVTQKEEDKYLIYDITYLWNLKNDTNELAYETERELQA